MLRLTCSASSCNKHRSILFQVTNNFTFWIPVIKLMYLYVIIENDFSLRFTLNYLIIVPIGTLTILCSPFLPCKLFFLPATPSSPLINGCNCTKLFTLCVAANTTWPPVLKVEEFSENGRIRFYYITLLLLFLIEIQTIRTVASVPTIRSSLVIAHELHERNVSITPFAP